MLAAFIVVVILVAGGPNAQNFEYAKNELKRDATDVLLTQYILVELAKIEEDIPAVSMAEFHNLDKKEVGGVMNRVLQQMIGQCQLIEDHRSEQSNANSCIFSDDEIESFEEWTKDNWRAYRKLRIKYKDCCQHSLIKSIAEANSSYGDETASTTAPNAVTTNLIKSSEAMTTIRSDSKIAECGFSGKITTILGFSIPALIILTVSVTIYLLLKTRYQIVKRSIQVQQKYQLDANVEVVEVAPAQARGPLSREGEIICTEEQTRLDKSRICGDQMRNMDKEQQSDCEDAIYDDLYLKRPTFSDRNNLYNTLTDERSLPTENSEEENYSILNKPSSTNQLEKISQQQMGVASERERKNDGPCQDKRGGGEESDSGNAVYSTICKDKMSRQKGGLIQRKHPQCQNNQIGPEDTEHDGNVSSSMEDGRDPSKRQQETTEAGYCEGEYNVMESVKIGSDKDCQENTYNVLNNSCRTVTSTQDYPENTGQDDPSRKIRPPKDTPVGKRYSCNLVLMNQPASQFAVKESWNEPPVEQSVDGEDHYQIPDELKS